MDERSSEGSTRSPCHAGQTAEHSKGSSDFDGPAASGKGKAAFRPYHSLNVPKQADLEIAFKSTDQPVTTLMLRHIPNKYTQANILQEIDFQGFAGTYDFFYMPMDIQNRTNVGYAFINFVTLADAMRFFQRFSSYKFLLYPSSKIGTVSPAHVQGMANNVLHFSNRAVAQSRNTQYRPIVIRHGRHYDISVVYAELREQFVAGRADQEAKYYDQGGQWVWVPGSMTDPYTYWGHDGSQYCMPADMVQQMQSMSYGWGSDMLPPADGGNLVDAAASAYAWPMMGHQAMHSEYGWGREELDASAAAWSPCAQEEGQQTEEAHSLPSSGRWPERDSASPEACTTNAAASARPEAPPTDVVPMPHIKSDKSTNQSKNWEDLALEEAERAEQELTAGFWRSAFPCPAPSPEAVGYLGADGARGMDGVVDIKRLAL